MKIHALSLIAAAALALPAIAVADPDPNTGMNGKATTPTTDGGRAVTALPPVKR